MSTPKNMIAKHLDRLTETIDTVFAHRPQTDPMLVIKALVTAEHTIADILGDDYKPVNCLHCHGPDVLAAQMSTEPLNPEFEQIFNENFVDLVAK